MEPDSAKLPRRRSIRLPGVDYTQNDSYFVTVCAAGKARLFGRVNYGIVGLSPLGIVVEREWLDTGLMRRYLRQDASIVMPNHFHALFTILRDADPGRGVACYARDGWPAGPPPDSVGAIIRAFKAAVTRRARHELKFEDPVWQRNYFERIIRNDREYSRAMDYIGMNPLRWEEDHENPTCRRI